MILRPESLSPLSNTTFVSAWEAVAHAEKSISKSYGLVRQPDHARLSGQIAEQLAIAGAPSVDDDIVAGISLHDEGWKPFDEGRERLSATPATYTLDNLALNAEGKPLSFLEICAGDFLRAWRASIDTAEAVAPIAGLIVSEHFCRLGRFGVSMGGYSDEDARSVREFLACEKRRWEQLLPLQSRQENEVRYWTDVLQFCDLLSLYLCCGSDANVEFPQRIGPHGEMIRLQLQEEKKLLLPRIFGDEVNFEVEARAYPAAKCRPLSRFNWRLV